MEHRAVVLEKRDGVALIRMNHPKSMNALDDHMAGELLAAYLDVAADDEVGAVILTGTEKAFCAGGDLKRLHEGFENTEHGYQYMRSFRELVLTFMNMPKPTISAVNGYAMGAGFCIAMQADLILAAENAKFSMAFVNVGLVPDLAGMYTLPRLVGLQRAKELVFTGQTIGAEEAREMGIVNHTVPEMDLLDEAMKLAKRLAAGPRVALRMAKKVMNSSADITLEQLLDMEPFAQAVCFDSKDHRIGVKAFLEKEKPIFTGS